MELYIQNIRGSKYYEYFKELLREEGGATAIEYGLIAALIPIVVILTLGVVGTNLDAVFTQIGTQLAQ